MAIQGGGQEEGRAASIVSTVPRRFDAELLAALGINPVLHELLSVELIDQVRFTPSAEYAFHHPLMRARWPTNRS